MASIDGVSWNSPQNQRWASACFPHSAAFCGLVVNENENAERGFRQANLKRDIANLELIQLDTAIKTSEILDEHGPRTRLTGFFKFGYSVSDFDYWTQRMKEKQAENEN